jgi:hypothetical protein
MRIRVKCPSTGRVFSASAVELSGRLYWVSSEGATLGLVGRSIAPYRILHFLSEGAKE